MPCSDSDSSFEKTPKKHFKPHPRLGPSVDRLRAYKHSCATAYVSSNDPVQSTSAAPLNDPEPKQDIAKNKDNQNDVASTSGTTSQNCPTDAPLLPSNDKPALLGRLSVTHYGLRKPKKDCRFKCKECEFVAASHKESNDHHKEKHDKCYCSICGKACNTPSTLARHAYSYRDELRFPC